MTQHINDAGATVTDIWSGSKITTELAGKADSSHTHDAADVTSGTFADARIAASNVTQHINDAGATVTDIWSGSKITTELGGKADSSHNRHPHKRFARTAESLRPSELVSLVLPQLGQMPECPRQASKGRGCDRDVLAALDGIARTWFNDESANRQ